MGVFNSMVNHLSGQTPRGSVNMKDFDKWQKQWLMDAIGGLRMGQSFCKYFGISNASPLYYFNDNSLSLRWICDNYLEHFDPA